MAWSWHKQAPKSPFAKVIWQICAEHFDEEEPGGGGSTMDTLKCHQGAVGTCVPAKGWLVHSSFCCFPAESHFDDCQCDFNAIFQLQRSPAPALPRGTCKRAVCRSRDTDRNADICGLNCNLCSCNIEAALTVSVTHFPALFARTG